MTTDPLPSEQADEAREIAAQEVERFGRFLLDEIAATPRRADGALSGLDAYKAVERATIRYAER